MGQSVCLQDDFNSRKKLSRIKKSSLQSSYRPRSHRLDQDLDQDHKNPLGSNKHGTSKALTGPYEAFVPIRSLQAPLFKAEIDVVWFTWKDLDQIIQSVLQAQTLKEESLSLSGDKFKAKSPDVYHSKFYIECYNFCQQYEDYFATVRAIGPNWIPFAAFFFWDQINFCWQQYNWKLEGENLVSITWDKFKAFFHKALGDFQASVDNYWAKIKQDS